jgi:Fe2+ or Zn2+ uptake regulation protein
MTVNDGCTGLQPCVPDQHKVSLGKASGGFKASEAKRFLELLGKDRAATWLRSIKPGRNGASEHQGLAGKADLNWITSKTNAGFNLFAVIGNATAATGKGGGVQDTDITGVPALFVEWDDGADIDTQAQRWQELELPEPTLMVSTGGKSVHCYWVLLEPISSEQWKQITARLIAHCNSDKACSNPSRVMRLPGSIYYDKKTGEPTGQCRIIAAAGHRYAAFDIDAALPAPAPAKPVTAAPSRQFEPRSEAELIDALRQVPVFAHGEGRREELLGLAFRLAAELGADRGLQLMQEHSPGVDDLADYFKTEPDRISAGSIWPFMREHYGIDISRSTDKAAKGTPPRHGEQGAPAAPLTFEQQWELLELHAAEVACSNWPVMKGIAAMSRKASELDIPRLGQRQIEQLLEQAQRRIRAKDEPVLGGGVFTIKATPWAVEGIFRHGLNLLTGQSGAGKSRLAAACMAAWLRGDQTWLQRKLQGDDPRHRHALIIGTDQNLEDWHLTLGPVGLTTKLSDIEVQSHDRLTIYSLETGIQLDADGLNTIRRWVDAHPGGMVLVDSLAQCLPPGVDEDKSSAARPVHQLQEVLGDAWAILTHHSRKGAGKEGNLGVGAGRGSGAIDAAVSRVVGLGLIYKMENGQMVAQESDPRRELLSTKRGGKTEHLIVSSDASGFWDVHGTAEALKAQERQHRALSNLTEAQSDVLGAVEAGDGWVTPRDVVGHLGEEYEATGSRAALIRKVLKRLEVLGMIESQRVGNERTYRATLNHPSQREVGLNGSTGSVIAAQGVSLVQQLVQHGSVDAAEPPEPIEPEAEPVKSTAAQALNQLNHLPVSDVSTTGSEHRQENEQRIRALRPRTPDMAGWPDNEVAELRQSLEQADKRRSSGFAIPVQEVA